MCPVLGALVAGGACTHEPFDDTNRMREQNREACLDAGVADCGTPEGQ